MDEVSIRRIEESLNEDGCTAKKLLDDVSFDDALKTVVQIGSKLGDRISTRVTAQGDTQTSRSPIAPSMTVSVLNANGWWPTPVYISTQTVDRNGTMSRRSIAPMCAETNQ